MQRPELLHPSSWPFNNTSDPSFDEIGIFDLDDMETHMGDWQFSSNSFTTSEDSSDITPVPYSPTIHASGEIQTLPFYGVDHDEGSQYPVNWEELCCFPNDQLVNPGLSEMIDHEIESSPDLLKEQYFFEEEEGEEEDGGALSQPMKSDMTSMDLSLLQQSLVLPTEDMEVDNQLCIFHLLEAYGEAMEMGLAELAEVTSRRVHEKASPLGATVERLAYYFFQALGNHGDYLRQESGKNYETAFQAFYQICPYGRVAHFTANTAILEAVPENAEVIHIIDFDMGEGIQWPPLIEALGQRNRTVRLTSIRWAGEEEESKHVIPQQWSFQQTKKRLCDHARSLGLKLKVERMDMEELVSEMKRMRKRDGGREREWMAFNCMMNLPHMGRSVGINQVMEFLRVAEWFISNNPSISDRSTSKRGIVVVGDGDIARDRRWKCSGFGSFFNGYLLKFHALLESMESHFPERLKEARVAMESLFVGPYVTSLDCFQKWEETRQNCDILSGFGLECWRLSRESLIEAKEMVREGEGQYEVRVEGQNGNEMVLEWRGIPLMRVSTWG